MTYPSYGEEIGGILTWMPQRLVDIYLQEWIEHGDPARAWAAVRQSSQYDVFFAGNRNEDGTLQYTELEYLSIMRGYENVIEGVGLNPNLFRDGFIEMIKGAVSPDEFQSRVDAITERVVFAQREIRKAYRDLGYTDRLGWPALLADALDPSIGDALFNKQITMAEIVGEGAIRGFEVDARMASELFGSGFNRQAAQTLFGQAAELLPVLGVLAARHEDPDDEFDLEEFTAATVFNDYETRSRMRRLIQQERSSFTQAGYFGTATDQRTGGFTGLAAR